MKTSDLEVESHGQFVVFAAQGATKHIPRSDLLSRRERTTRMAFLDQENLKKCRPASARCVKRRELRVGSCVSRRITVGFPRKARSGSGMNISGIHWSPTCLSNVDAAFDCGATRGRLGVKHLKPGGRVKSVLYLGRRHLCMCMQGIGVITSWAHSLEATLRC